MSRKWLLQITVLLVVKIGFVSLCSDCMSATHYVEAHGVPKNIQKNATKKAHVSEDI